MAVEFKVTTWHQCGVPNSWEAVLQVVTVKDVAHCSRHMDVFHCVRHILRTKGLLQLLWRVNLFLLENEFAPKNVQAIP